MEDKQRSSDLIILVSNVFTSVSTSSCDEEVTSSSSTLWMSTSDDCDRPWCWPVTTPEVNDAGGVATGLGVDDEALWEFGLPRLALREIPRTISAILLSCDTSELDKLLCRGETHYSSTRNTTHQQETPLINKASCMYTNQTCTFYLIYLQDLLYMYHFV